MFLTSAAVITNDDYCAHQFVTDLRTFLKSREKYGSHPINVNHVIIGRANHTSNSLFDDLYDLKTHSISLVIPLTPGEYLGDIFNVASKFEMLEAPNTWLIPTYNDNMVATRVPTRILMFQHMDNQYLGEKLDLNAILPVVLTEFQNSLTVCNR